MKKINIRKITEQDFPVLLDMIKEFASYLEKLDEVKITIDILKKNQESFQCFFAETEDNQIAGYAFTFFTFHTWSGRALYLEDLYVKEEYRRHSVGIKLMDHLIEFAKENKCHNLSWQVLEWNESAIKFYTKLNATIGDDMLNCNLSITF